ncbi:uncharacterized protein LODBEIA_P21320 [Lodderomyces beijingensis]|uniref:Mitochondrial zinc maintenance protein 1, mitochondrial n=1 Tax=Lodderomyces beijingensis TaxID=1775926 RepID=A0ABP0ZJU2_9ASCO
MSAKAAYKNALKSIHFVFKNDIPVQQAAKSQVKSEMMAKSQLSDPHEIQEAVEKLNAVSKFLVQNLVQGELQSNGRYFLNFHDQTELGDNESIKNSKSEMGSLSGARGKSIRGSAASKCS